MIKALHFEAKGFLGQIIGPVFLICSVFLAAHAASIPNYDLALASILGLIVCAKWHLRGCLFALALLAVCAGLKHLFLSDHHLWQAGVELSVALAMITTALVFHQDATFIDGLQAQAQAHLQTIEYLEEDLQKSKEASTAEGTMASEKLNELRIQLEEALTESSTYQVLNDVLRKSTAKVLEQKELLTAKLLQSNRKEGQLFAELDLLQKELNRIGDESAVVQQNSQLFRELNEARVKEAQTHLVNETLVRLHRNEHVNVVELSAKKEILTEDLLKVQAELTAALNQIEALTEKTHALEATSAAFQEVESQKTFLSERVLSLESFLETFEATKSQCQAYSEQVQVLEATLEASKGENSTWIDRAKTVEVLLDEANQRCHFFNEKVQALELELQKKVESGSLSSEKETFLLEKLGALVGEREKDALQMKTLQVRLAQYADMELLYRQLKGNFEEKKKTLHQTRAELFHTDTELQTLKRKIQLESVEVELLPEVLLAEFDNMEIENKILQEENKTLHELVSRLMDSPVPETTVKKKVKRPVLAIQEDLFGYAESI